MKKDILKEVGNQTVLVSINFNCMDSKYKWSRWDPKLLDYQH